MKSSYQVKGMMIAFTMAVSSAVAVAATWKTNSAGVAYILQQDGTRFYPYSSKPQGAVNNAASWKSCLRTPNDIASNVSEWTYSANGQSYCYLFTSDCYDISGSSQLISVAKTGYIRTGDCKTGL